MSVPSFTKDIESCLRFYALPASCCPVITDLITQTGIEQEPLMPLAFISSTFSVEDFGEGPYR